jgi:hypothetical protein
MFGVAPGWFHGRYVLIGYLAEGRRIGNHRLLNPSVLVSVLVSDVDYHRGGSKVSEGR